MLCFLESPKKLPDEANRSNFAVLNNFYEVVNGFLMLENDDVIRNEFQRFVSTT